jgi:hypothetical protein
VLDHCSKFTGPTSGTGAGEIVITAANGDQLFLAEQATFDLVLENGGPRWSVISMTWQVEDGTGRFFGADGAGTMSGLGDLVASTTAATFTGHIAYDASSRSH